MNYALLISLIALSSCQYFDSFMKSTDDILTDNAVKVELSREAIPPGSAVETEIKITPPEQHTETSHPLPPPEEAF